MPCREPPPRDDGHFDAFDHADRVKEGRAFDYVDRLMGRSVRPRDEDRFDPFDHADGVKERAFDSRDRLRGTESRSLRDPERAVRPRSPHHPSHPHHLPDDVP